MHISSLYDPVYLFDLLKQPRWNYTTGVAFMAGLDACEEQGLVYWIFCKMFKSFRKDELLLMTYLEFRFVHSALHESSCYKWVILHISVQLTCRCH